MGSTKYDIEKFIYKNDFSLGRMKMKALLVHQGLKEALQGKKKLPTTMIDKKKEMLDKAYVALVWSLADKVCREVSKEKIFVTVWLKLENLYMTKSLTNRLYFEVEIIHHQDANRQGLG
uniref:Retrovirus-related Pol polyprotein from transposon TNT 1-94 n=1 Tax=Cajanus cajan TaxID=3821 RepID=A0A151SZM0_CAJCA|nr:Retrovirus-related Pol polyprotein from transposon TNT 1-94 [Cajanus cajan]